jgi:hypothetical protein
MAMPLCALASTRRAKGRSARLRRRIQPNNKNAHRFRECIGRETADGTMAGNTTTANQLQDKVSS